MRYSNEKEFWSVGKYNGRSWQIRKASTSNPEEYTIVEDLGPVLNERGEDFLLDACLEFDGNFALARGDTVIRLITEENPWIALVRYDGDLYIKQVGIPAGQNGVYPVLLDLNCTKVSLCRSWINRDLIFRDTSDRPYHPDQGFVCAYIKRDGSVWYREKKLRNLDEPFWDDPVQILDAGVGNTDVKCFRLNDYRLCIYVKGINRLYVSERTYISNTVKDEFVKAKFNQDFLVLSNRNTEIESDGLLEVVSCSFESDTLVDTEFNFPIFDYDPSWKDIEWAGTKPQGQSIQSLSMEGKHLKIQLSIPMPNHNMELKFRCRANNRKGYFISDQARPIWPALTWIKEQVPIQAALQNQGICSVVAGVDFISFDARPLADIKQLYEDFCNVDASLSLVSFNSRQVNDVESTYEEMVSVLASVSFISFDSQQSGDTPI